MKGNTEIIKDIAIFIKPAINGTARLEDAVKANIQWTVAHLKQTPVLKELISEKKVDCIGAYYHLDTGKIEIIK